MKALTLTEPWATLMALRMKQIETRSWKIPGWLIGTDIAIHSAKGFPKWARETCEDPPFNLCLAGVDVDSNRGKVLCIVRFEQCLPVEEVRDQIIGQELAFGDYSDGRFAWVSRFVRETKHVAVTGHLGFWDLPKGIEL